MVSRADALAWFLSASIKLLQCKCSSGLSVSRHMELIQMLKASGVPTEALSAMVSSKKFWLVCRKCADTFSAD